MYCSYFVPLPDKVSFFRIPGEDLRQDANIYLKRQRSIRAPENSDVLVKHVPDIFVKALTK